jgi:hypothetical protein
VSSQTLLKKNFQQQFLPEQNTMLIQLDRLLLFAILILFLSFSVPVNAVQYDADGDVIMEDAKVNIDLNDPAGNETELKL